MKRFGNTFISFAAPLLILLSILGFFHRESRDRIKSLPALLVAGGLVITGTFRRFRRRSMLLTEIKKNMDEMDEQNV
tara:strand:+ start:1101 stop:1331 length:231 start_codon:yes stop_codon:yes gene_type:complete